MRRRIFYVFSFAVLIGLAGLAFAINKQFQEKNRPPKIPGFRFPAISGVEFSNANLLTDRPTVIMYTSPNCIYCHEALNILADNQEIFTSCQFVMIFPFDAVDVEKFLMDHSEVASNPNLLVLLDPFKEFATLFGPSNFPSLYVYSKGGELIKKIDGLSRIEVLKEFIGED